MTTLIYIFFVRAFAFVCIKSSEYDEKVSITRIVGLIGYFVYYALIIWGFWHYDWWQLILLYIAGFPLTYNLCVTGVVVFTILAIIELINM